MLKSVASMILVITLAACAHRGAVRVDCDGPLRPVNSPIESHEPPVSVDSPKSDYSPNEKRP
jgi:hypothetical protein